MRLYFYFFMFVTLLFDILGDTFAKKWSIDTSYISLALLVIFYAVSGVLWGISLKYEYLSKGTLIINILNVLVMVLVGIFFFKEHLSLLNKAGVLMGIISLALLTAE